jgi:hypothetical protein
MNKKGTQLIFAALVAVFVASAILLPAMTTVFAAEQTTDQEQQPTSPSGDAPQDGGNEHSGHHM